MKTLITIAFLAISIITIEAQSSTNNELQTIFDEHTPIALKDHNVPGLAVAIIKGGDVIFKKGYGYADVDQKEIVNFNTGFNIGSISKMFTAWGIMKLVEKKEIDLDAPYSNYLKKWRLPYSEFDSKKVTIRNLLQHTAGLSVHGYDGFECKNELTSITESLVGATHEEEAVKLIMDPESKWQYSGGGYSILQLVIEEVSGKTFEKFMEENIFEPLKMKHTSFSINKKILTKSAKAYDENAKEIPLRLFNAQAAAGLHTTLDDLILFAKASFSNNPVLTSESIRLLIEPTDISKGNYGMGYMIMNRFGDFTLCGHGGSNEGWQSGFMLDFESKSGIIVLTNGSSGKNVLFGSLKDWAKWHSNTE